MTQNEIIEMAIQAGMTQDGDMWFSFGKGDMDVEHKHLEAFANAVAAQEREACAQYCDMNSHSTIDMAAILAEAIRARGEE